MQSPSLLARDDTFFGVCQGIGEDLGVSPLILRLAFTALLFFYPVAALSGYAGLGAVVAFSRWLYPAPPAAIAEEPAMAEAEAEPEALPLPLAA